MNQHDDEQERQLQALFDATSAPSDHEQLARLARHSAQIPQQAPRRWWQGAAPWLAAGLVAAGALVLVRQRDVDNGRAERPQPIASLQQNATAAHAGSAEWAPAFADEPALWNDEGEDPLAALNGPEASEQDPFAVLELLYAPEDDAALQLVNAAYEASLADRDGAEQNGAEQNGR